MKLGAENRNKAIAAAVLGAIATVLVIRMFVGGAVPAPAPSAAASQPPPARTRAARGGSAASISPLDPRLRLDLLKTAENTEYQGSGRDIFRAEAAPPPIPKVVQNPDQTATNNTPPPPPQPTGPPPLPPINLKFFGFANRPGEPTKVFLSADDQVFVASQGQIVKGRYKIVRITPTSVDIEDVLNNNKQTLPLSQG